MKQVVTWIVLAVFGMVTAGCTIEQPRPTAQAYPRYRQTANTQAQDDADCSAWASEQTGYRPSGCVPPFTHPVTQRVEGLSLENPQHPEKGTLSPDRSECSAVGLRQTGSHHGFSPAVGADASLTPSWTHAGACPGLFSADIAKLDPSDHQRIGESYPDAGHPELGYPVSAVAVEAWHALHCAHSQRYSPAAG